MSIPEPDSPPLEPPIDAVDETATTVPGGGDAHADADVDAGADAEIGGDVKDAPRDVPRPIGPQRLRRLREAIRSGAYPTDTDVTLGLEKLFRRP